MAAEERGGGERRVNVSGLTDRLETVGHQHGGQGGGCLSCLVAGLYIIARITPDRSRETDRQTDSWHKNRKREGESAAPS